MKKKQVPACKCNKKLFDKKGAVTAMNWYQKEGRTQDKIPRRVYPCPCGAGWHLTSDTNDKGLKAKPLIHNKKFNRILQKQNNDMKDERNKDIADHTDWSNDQLSKQALQDIKVTEDCVKKDVKAQEISKLQAEIKRLREEGINADQEDKTPYEDLADAVTEKRMIEKLEAKLGELQTPIDRDVKVQLTEDQKKMLREFKYQVSRTTGMGTLSLSDIVTVLSGTEEQAWDILQKMVDKKDRAKEVGEKYHIQKEDVYDTKLPVEGTTYPTYDKAIIEEWTKTQKFPEPLNKENWPEVHGSKPIPYIEEDKMYTKISDVPAGVTFRVKGGIKLMEAVYTSSETGKTKIRVAGRKGWEDMMEVPSDTLCVIENPVPVNHEGYQKTMLKHLHLQVPIYGSLEEIRDEINLLFSGTFRFSTSFNWEDVIYKMKDKLEATIRSGAYIQTDGTK